MYRILYFLIFVFLFWFGHTLRRILNHTYIWQLKEYRLDRVQAFIKEKKILSLKSYPTIIAFALTILGIIVTKYSHIRPLYIIFVIGFGYFVYSSLGTLTALISKRLSFPKKSIRNLLIVGCVLIASIIPLISSYTFYRSIYIEIDGRHDNVSPELITDIDEFFPQRMGDTDYYAIPLETGTIILSFVLLFAFDLILPALVALFVFITSVFSTASRKKKSKRQKKKSQR
ncbi:MAG: hypothetical protein PHS44_04150 [Candidatus Dojkabacteria bacterium]|nr:hypothetical protein [Candidatus Dojkabacteria bacterium]